MSTHETDWPCATDPSADLPDRLVAALYVLARDHVAPGDLEQVLLNVRPHGEPLKVAYSNPHLLALAQAHATFLLEGFRTSYPYKEGDWLILGPQCFLTLSDDGKGVHIINYQGQNFIPQAEPENAVAADDSSEKADLSDAHIPATERASEIAVTYPSGKHVFSAVGDDGWLLYLYAGPGQPASRVTGYDNMGVLRVVSAFLGDPKPSPRREFTDANEMTPSNPRRCPRCGSPDPARHPATSFEGEVQPCTDSWHDIERDGLPEPKTIEDGQTLDEQVAAAHARAGGVLSREEGVGVIELVGGDIVYKDKHYTPLTLDDATGQGRR